MRKKRLNEIHEVLPERFTLGIAGITCGIAGRRMLTILEEMLELGMVRLEPMRRPNGRLRGVMWVKISAKPAEGGALTVRRVPPIRIFRRTGARSNNYDA